MSALCIIPARGGSKRIPRKNIRAIAGLPIIAHSIATALKSGCFDEVMVSTDDREIAEVALEHGATVPFRRSADTSNDHATTAAVMMEVLAEYERRERRVFDLICCLYPASILVRPEQLRTGCGLLQQDARVETVMSVQAFAHPIERAFRLRGGRLVPVNPETQQMRTQDLSAAYHDAGQFYFFRASGLFARGCIVGENCVPVLLSPWEAVDLDTEEDWERLERTVLMEKMA